jgi:LysM repeat protein
MTAVKAMTANQATGLLGVVVLVAVAVTGVLSLDLDVRSTAGRTGPSVVEIRMLERSVPVRAITYEVEPGDTLSSIAASFGTTPEDVLARNELESADRLSVGQVLEIITLERAPAHAPAALSP